MHSLQGKNLLKKRRSSLFLRASDGVGKVVQQPAVVVVGKCSLLLSIITGLTLAIFTLVTTSSVYSECRQRIGPISSCAEEKYYFASGFFSKPTCAFDQIKTFQCTSDDVLFQRTQILPDAVEEYALMRDLTLINVSNSSLESSPRGWANVPHDLTIDLRHSIRFAELPFALCSFRNQNLSRIELDGTKAASALNWTGQLLDSIFRINYACESELTSLTTFTTLSLAGNNLTSSSLDREFLLSLNFLVNLDLRNNKIKQILLSVGEGIFSPVVARLVKNKQTADGSGLQLEGNPVEELRLNALPREDAVQWIRMLSSMTSLRNVRFANCRADGIPVDPFCAAFHT